MLPTLSSFAATSGPFALVSYSSPPSAATGEQGEEKETRAALCSIVRSALCTIHAMDGAERGANGMWDVVERHSTAHVRSHTPRHHGTPMECHAVHVCHGNFMAYAYGLYGSRRSVHCMSRRQDTHSKIALLLPQHCLTAMAFQVFYSKRRRSFCTIFVHDLLLSPT